jgi:hypothetical protein
MQRMPSPVETARHSPNTVSAASASVAAPEQFDKFDKPEKPDKPDQPDRFDKPISLATRRGARWWLKGLLTGLGSARSRVADIQQSMLAELSQIAAMPLHEEKLARLIVQARDAEALWQLRHALADAICAVHGELVARQKMTEISFMFAGLLRRRPGSTPPGADNVVRLSPRGPQPGVNP